MQKPGRLAQARFASRQKGGQDDPYLSALEFLAFFHGKPFSAAEILNTLPLEGGKLDAGSFARAAARFGLKAKAIERDPSSVSGIMCPYLVPMSNGEVAIATDRLRRGRTRLVIPGWPNVLNLAAAVLDRQSAGVVILVADASDDGEDVARENRGRGHWLWSVVRKYWATWFYVVVAALVINLLALAVPLFVRNVYDRVIPNNSMATLWALAAGVMIALSFDFILRMLRAVVIDQSGSRVDMRVSADLFEQAMDASMATRPARAGELASHIREFESVRDFFTSSSIASLIDLLFIGIFIGVLWLLVGPLAYVSLVAVPVVLAGILLIHFPLGRSVARAHATAANRQSILVEALVGIETVKAMSAEGAMQRKWESAVSGSVRSGSSIRFWSALAMYFAMFVQQCVTVVTLVLGVYMVAAGDITIGALIAANILAGRVLAPLSGIAMTLVRAQQSFGALRQLNKLMRLERDHANAGDNIGPVREGRLQLRELCFVYSGQEKRALDGVSITIAPGERVGIIGRTGSGKSTLGKLISGLHVPESGNVMIDDADLRHYNRSDVRSAIVYAGQDGDLFSGSIRENVMIANPMGEDQFEACVRATGVASFVQTHPLGFSMPVGERGQRLSGGQRQCVALARALMADPRILFLDEPTSAMDNFSEAIFIRGMREWLRSDVTLLVATHRMSLLDLVSRLVVMENGRIVEDGPRNKVLESLKSRSLSSPQRAIGGVDGPG